MLAIQLTIQACYPFLSWDKMKGGVKVLLLSVQVTYKSAFWQKDTKCSAIWNCSHGDILNVSFRCISSQNIPLGPSIQLKCFEFLKLLHSLGFFFCDFLILLFIYFFILCLFFCCFNCTFTIFPPSCGGISSESLPAGLFLHRCFIAFLVLQTAVLPTNLCLFQLNIHGKGKIRHHLMKNGRRDRCLVLSEKYRGESYKLTEYFWR